MAAAAEDVDTTEEFMVWKKNTPLIYELVISHALEWPSLTVQWLPTPTTTTSSSAAATERLILGTHTSDGSPNFLMIADVHFPQPPSLPKVQISQTIPHEGEVNRARFMPQNPALIATKTCASDVHLFDITSWPSGNVDGDAGGCSSSDASPSVPDMVLKGHTKEGYGISWSPLKEGYLLSGSYDSKICLWDVGASPKKSNVLSASYVYEAHEDVVEDVAWHSRNESLFGSVGDDHMLMLWDLRTSTTVKPQHAVEAHQKEVYSLSFNPFNEWILATASADTTVNLFDLRKLTTSLHTFSSHTDEVLQVEWSPTHETILASSAADRRVMVWDLSRIGDEQISEDAEDGPPELIFVHGGHTDKISEFSWNCTKPRVIVSVAEDNILQVWQMTESIFRDDHDASFENDLPIST